MAREIKEVSVYRTDLKKYGENYEHIFGNKKKESEENKDQVIEPDEKSGDENGEHNG